MTAPSASLAALDLAKYARTTVLRIVAGHENAEAIIEAMLRAAVDEALQDAALRALPAPPAILGTEGDDWKQAALTFGEQLAANGPTGYYGFTPAEWLKWALTTRAQPDTQTSEKEKDDGSRL